ncbi:hypothetical protein [Streptomyces sp. NPDC058045]|uniref:hypothetical protein n=1 Tax=Streptomyces sp. NPDC058045 TaxID=3346311 RepID=UPI0036F190D6
MSFGQGGPSWGSGGSGPESQPPQWGAGQRPEPWAAADSGQPTPDWAALADAAAARGKRRKLLMAGGAAVATVAIGAAVAFAVVSASGDDKKAGGPGGLPATADIPPSATAAEPTFAETTPPPPPDPKDFVSSADKDKAPLSPGTLFPEARLSLGDHDYAKGATDSTGTCASVTHGPLGAVLDKNDCTRVLRATYHRGKVAVTVGVAVFDTEKQATRAKDQADKGNIRSLPGKGVSGFCNTVVCRSTTNSYGRYAYFTVTGYTSGKNVTKKDREVFTTGDDLAEYTFRRIIHRGEVQASAAMTAP